MDFNTIIEKKKHKIELSKEEIYFLINSYIKNEIKDYQMSSFLMAVWFNKLTDSEFINFNNAIIDSGYQYKFKKIKADCIDKHSTGGIGDKTSLIFGPVLASMGFCVCKISGRGLGQTGGTIDKLEACKGWNSEIDNEKFEELLLKNNFSIIGQSDNIVPADKLLYALRDVTGTIDSEQLIATSIMSKKLVMPSNCIILDVKVGDGAFMKDVTQAKKLAKLMKKLADNANRKIGFVFSDMNRPLGKAIGNAIEVKEAYNTLNGDGPEDLVELVSYCCALALYILNKRSDIIKTQDEIKEILKNKSAAPYLKKMIEDQNGDFSLIENYDKNFKTKYIIEIKAEKSGYIEYTSSYKLGMLSTYLGGGKLKKEDVIDHAAGIYLNKQSGQKVNKGDVIMKLFTNIFHY